MPGDVNLAPCSLPLRLLQLYFSSADGASRTNSADRIKGLLRRESADTSTTTTMKYDGSFGTLNNACRGLRCHSRGCTAGWPDEL